MEFDIEFAVNPCPECGCECEPLGQLGRLLHFRCRACGWIHEQPLGEVDEASEQ